MQCDAPCRARCYGAAADGLLRGTAGAIDTGPSLSFSSASLLCSTGPTITTGHRAGVIHFLTTRLTSARETFSTLAANVR